MKERFVKIPVGELQLGMYVAELDRPWLDSPFLVQGFTLNAPSELDVIVDICTYVVVDMGRSHLTRDPQSGKKPLGKSLKETFSTRKLRSYEDSHSFDDELEMATGIYEQYEQTIEKLYDNFRSGNSVDISAANEVVKNIVDSIIRNPDACVYLQQMRKKGDYIYNHAIGTSIWAAALARQIGLPPLDIKKIALGGLLCDIGKVRVTSRILNKPSTLSAEEFLIIQSHVDINEEFTKHFVGIPQTALEIIGNHHERHDGSGYPNGLSGDEIPVFSRIVAIADSYDAMTNHRSYAKALSPCQSCKELYEIKDILFQGEIVDEFIQAVGIYPVGSLVELNTGEVGVVISEYRKRRLQPKLLMLLDSSKEAISGTTYLDLFQHNNGDIQGEPVSITHSLEIGAYGLDPDDFFQ